MATSGDFHMAIDTYAYPPTSWVDGFLRGRYAAGYPDSNASCVRIGVRTGCVGAS